ncbi:hypothetical protein P154DRAFT_526647 [Amniculicola lignicola CBS 123094]|uniref:Uncharacterized protein n=1 Tax=Amniculicola lignicola CBS 123094 TaxID=1392246 RepID=A0A6A5W148_9PLEO|nr:hypothetical protein P154DRAFT_526647 [Amniculicola lignicola CBS 123094]
MPALPVLRDAVASLSHSLATRDMPALQTPRRSIAHFFNERFGPAKRQVQPGIIPTYYRTNGPSAALVAGIVLGSVAGFLLIFWLLYSLFGYNSGHAIAAQEEVIVRRRRNSGNHSQRSRRSTRTEVREYSRSPRRPVVVEERRGPRVRSVVVEERSRVPGDDVVEVIEEHDEYRTRRGARRSGGYR